MYLQQVNDIRRSPCLSSPFVRLYMLEFATRSSAPYDFLLDNNRPIVQVQPMFQKVVCALPEAQIEISFRTFPVW